MGIRRFADALMRGVTQSMKLVLLGAPGAGKGTIAQSLSKKLAIPSISTGDIFRQNIAEKTPLGILAKKYMDAGELVPDDVVTQIVENRLCLPDCAGGFILDGFPRTIAQAQALDEALQKRGEKLTAVIDVRLSETIIIDRLLSRRVCNKCGYTYNTQFIMPTKEGVCDECGGKIVKRDDDNEETIKKRLEVYHAKTQPLIQYYESQKQLIHIDNQYGMEQSLKRIADAISTLPTEGK